SAISLLEHIVAYVQMRFQWTRRRADLVVTASIMLMGIPVSLSFGPLSDVTFGGKTIFDILDYLTSNILMPLFGIAVCLIFGWSRKANALIPENITGLKRQSLLLVWRYVGPVCIGVILVHGLIS
ncbi:sodium-dependent transporter, partial [Morganella morganii]|nr:sodium-dependent transporter [Morganella morganii]